MNETWGVDDPRTITSMATDHILNALAYIDGRRLELTRELAEINVKAMEMKRVIESRNKEKK